MVWERSDRNNPAKRRTLKMLDYFSGRLDIFAKNDVDAIFEGFLGLFPTGVVDTLWRFGHFYLSAQINRHETLSSNNWQHIFLDFSTKIIWATIELFCKNTKVVVTIIRNRKSLSRIGHSLDIFICAPRNPGFKWTFMIPLMLCRVS